MCEKNRAELERELRESKYAATKRAASAEQAAKAMSELFEKETSRLLRQLEESEARRRAADRRNQELEELVASMRRERLHLQDESQKFSSSSNEVLSLRAMLDKALRALMRYVVSSETVPLKHHEL